VGSWSWAPNWVFAPKPSKSSALSGNVNMFGSPFCARLHYSLCELHTACWPHGTMTAEQPSSHLGQTLSPSSCSNGCDTVSWWCVSSRHANHVQSGLFILDSTTILHWPQGLCGMMACALLALCMCHEW
jgi:hypothetical protein